jgi:hypothetical protein
MVKLREEFKLDGTTTVLQLCFQYTLPCLDLQSKRTEFESPLRIR